MKRDRRTLPSLRHDERRSEQIRRERNLYPQRTIRQKIPGPAIRAETHQPLHKFCFRSCRRSRWHIHQQGGASLVCALTSPRECLPFFVRHSLVSFHGSVGGYVAAPLVVVENAGIISYSVYVVNGQKAKKVKRLLGVFRPYFTGVLRTSTTAGTPRAEKFFLPSFAFRCFSPTHGKRRTFGRADRVRPLAPCPGFAQCLRAFAPFGQADRVPALYAHAQELAKPTHGKPKRFLPGLYGSPCPPLFCFLPV